MDSAEERELRRVAMSTLKASIKAKKGVTIGDVAYSSNKSVSWVGLVLKGDYPCRGSNILTENIAQTLTRMGFVVPDCLHVFDSSKKLPTASQLAYIDSMTQELALKPASPNTQEEASSLIAWLKSQRAVTY